MVFRRPSGIVYSKIAVLVNSIRITGGYVRMVLML